MTKDLQIMAYGVCQLGYSSKLLGGVWRLGQKYAIELLTEKGSMRYLPNRGCSFLKRLRRAARTEFDVVVAFVAARNQLRRLFRGEETIHTPLSERYSSATLNEIVLDQGSLQIEFTVRSKAGTSVRVLTPPINL